MRMGDWEHNYALSQSQQTELWSASQYIGTKMFILGWKRKAESYEETRYRIKKDGRL